MASFVRAKRVTDPLDDRVRAILIGKELSAPVYASSGSDHSGDGGEDSPCLSDLVLSFLEPAVAAQLPETESESEPSHSASARTVRIEEFINCLVRDNADIFSALLLSLLSEATAACSCLDSNKPTFRRNVMAFLRNRGHNAAICKTKWPSCPNLTAGSYEFIDVVKSESSRTRYFIDLDFSSQFEIARPTEGYTRLLQSLPRAYVGKAEHLKKIVKAMCDEAKRSLKGRELHVPPWRKNRYMQNKWFGPYRRTTSQTPAASQQVVPPAAFTVICRFVGFGDAVSGVNGSLFVSPATRTR